MEFRVLGPIEVIDDRGVRLDLGAPKQRALLALLLIHANEVLSTDRILEALWGEDPPAGGHKTLQYHVSRLRSALGSGAGLLQTEHPGYRLEVTGDSIDAERFATHVEKARAHAVKDPAGCVAMLDEALGWWRGAPLADLAYEGFTQAKIRFLIEARLAAIEDRFAALLASGRHVEAVGQIDAMVEEHPYRERLRSQLMLAYYRSGRQAEALAAFQSARRALGEGLGIEPSEDLRRLEEMILMQDPKLDYESDEKAATSLPDGIVTLLWTDVEGSTRLWDQRGEEMQLAMARHDEILGEAIASNDGIVVRQMNDGMLAVFRSVPAAISAAVAGQLRLEAERWPGGTRPPVRMGLHTGEPERRGDDYFGAVINRTARLGAAAHGGQIVVSTGVAAIAMEDLPENVELVDLGQHRLRDLSQPERVFQVVHNSLEREFPPLRTLEEYSHNLPIVASSFVGRSSLLTDVHERLEDTRLLTLSGTGGAGKTRLALQVAANRLDAHTDGVWLIKLESTDRDEQAMQAAVDAIGARPWPGGSTEDALKEWGRPKDALLIVDNCEHVALGAAQLVALFLESCPHIRILATSRRSLGVPGETIYEIPPLDLPQTTATGDTIDRSEAVQLFVDRATASNQDFTIDDNNRTVIGDICRRLDGLPLAIELAAARMRMMSAAEVADRLDDRFRILTGGASISLPHRQTLRAAVEWSYALLDEPVAVLFDRLSVFRGGFTMDAVEHVCSGREVSAADTMDMLGTLADHSMVTVDRGPSGTRYRLLDTLWQLAQEHLAAHGEHHVYADRHAEYFAEEAERARTELRGPNEAAWMDRLDDELPNLRRAVTWSLGRDAIAAMRIIAGLLAFFMARDELVLDAQRWVREGVEIDRGDHPELTARTLSVGGLLAWSWGQLEDAEALNTQALEMARISGDADAIFESATNLGLVHVDRGAIAEARSLFEEAHALAVAAQDPMRIAWSLLNLGEVESPQRQTSLIDEARRLYETLGLKRGIANSTLKLGWLKLSGGDVAEAERHFATSKELWGALANHSSESVATVGLADGALARGELEVAASRAGDALTQCREFGWRMGEALALNRIVRVALTRGEVDEALHTADEAISIWREADLEPGLARALGMAAIAAAASGELGGASQFLNECRELWVHVDRPAGLAWSAVVEAELIEIEHGSASALPAFVAALELYEVAAEHPVTVDGLLCPEVHGLGDYLSAADRLAWCAVANDRPKPGLELLAAITNARTESGIVIPACDRNRHDEAVLTVRNSLPAADYEAAWSAASAKSISTVLSTAAFTA